MTRARRAKCPETGKWSYATSADALVAAVVRYRNVGRGSTARAYRCEHCGAFHLTTQPLHSRGSRLAGSGNDREGLA